LGDELWRRDRLSGAIVTSARPQRRTGIPRQRPYRRRRRPRRNCFGAPLAPVSATPASTELHRAAGALDIAVRRRRGSDAARTALLPACRRRWRSASCGAVPAGRRRATRFTTARAMPRGANRCMSATARRRRCAGRPDPRTSGAHRAAARAKWHGPAAELARPLTPRRPGHRRRRQHRDAHADGQPPRPPRDGTAIGPDARELPSTGGEGTGGAMRHEPRRALRRVRVAANNPVPGDWAIATSSARPAGGLTV
jgi:hypothetical protein